MCTFALKSPDFLEARFRDCWEVERDVLVLLYFIERHLERAVAVARWKCCRIFLSVHDGGESSLFLSDYVV